VTKQLDPIQKVEKEEEETDIDNKNSGLFKITKECMTDGLFFKRGRLSFIYNDNELKEILESDIEGINPSA